MPLIDLLCHYGVTDTTLAIRPQELSRAKTYADQFGVEMLCFVAREAASDIHGGNAKLAQALAIDARFRGWLTLSTHQTEASHELARLHLLRGQWIGARLEQDSDDDAINTAGGREVLNALRRYGRPVLVTATTPVTLHAVVEAAAEFHSLRFILNPQSPSLATDAVHAIKQAINVSLLPSAAFAERDLIAQAFAVLGDRRVLWCSDWGRHNPVGALGMIKDSAISGLQRERVGYRNASDLLSAGQ